MKRALWILVSCLCAVAAVRATPPPASIAGRYVADDGDHGIELFLRGEILCGRITWTKDSRLTDGQNPEPALRARKVAGVEHLRGLKQARDGVWSGGTLYNPEDGETYEAKLWLQGESRLIIKGRPSVPVFGGILGALFGRIAYTREKPQ